MHARFSTTLAVFVGLTVASCAGTNVTPGTPVANPVAQAVAPAQHAIKAAHAKVPRDLYIASPSQSVVYMLRNKTYRGLGGLTSGVNEPRGVVLDRQGNLYVANAGAGNITEYAPGSKSPTFTYSANMNTPDNVTVDAFGDVFEADNDGFINEYFQGVNVAFSSCGLFAFGNILGLAVDTSGDVFVSANFPNYNEHNISELPGGLGNCGSGTTYFWSNSVITGMVLDKNNNLLIANGNAVDVLAPPYTYVTGTIGSGFSNVTDVKLNKANTLAFVTDSANQTVTVVSYPGGSNVKVLGPSNGLQQPQAAVDVPNYVP